MSSFTGFAELSAPLLGPAMSAGSILCFHSVVTPELPSAGVVNIELGRLQHILEAASAVARIVPLRELVKRHLAGRSTARLVAITFDDAYAALLDAANRLFRPAQLPITVFVTSAAARTGGTFWWDRMDDLYPHVATPRWLEFERAIGLPEQYREGQPPEFGPLRPIRQWMLAVHRGRLPSSLEMAIAALEAEVGFRTCQHAMTLDDVARLAGDPLIDIGVHTVSHPVLPLLPDEEIEDEIRRCHDILRACVPRTLPVLAIPFGLFDSRSVRVARSCGMQASLTLSPYTLRAYDSCDWLPRFCMTRREKPWKLLVRISGVRERLWWPPRNPPTEYPAMPSPTS